MTRRGGALRPRSRSEGAGAADGEWVGGRLVAPLYVTAGQPYRPEMILWLELPEDLVVGLTFVDPAAAPVSFAQTFLDACGHPAVGRPRRPSRVRVAEASLAAELRAAVGTSIDVTVAPTPELDAVLQHMARSMPGGGETLSYFEGGRVSRAAVAKLFDAARFLYVIAPWKVASDDQVLRLDIPALDVSGACVSIIGALGESFGVIIFPSSEGYEAFTEVALEGPPVGPVDFGTTYLSLNYERAADLPPPMRREALQHGWPVASPDAYPRVEHRDPDGVPRPLVERDVAVATACASALAAFFGRHGDLFRHDAFAPVSESYTNDDGLTVRLTAPYDAAELFAPAEWATAVATTPPAATPRASAPRVGRNDPCPCGSGKKYKHCHLAADEAWRGPGPAPAHDRDERLVEAMTKWALNRFGDRSLDAADDFRDPEATVQLSLPWTLFHGTVDGRTIVDWYLDEHGRRLTREDRDWLGAQRGAWLSIWEVQAAEPGVGLEVRDLLTGATRRVREASGSKVLVRRDTVLGRVVDYEGESLFCGVHPRPLGPVEAAEVVRKARSRLRLRRAVPVERLRDEALGRYLIARWEEAAEESDRRRAVPPELHNTDGDDLLLTTDHFAFDRSRRNEVAARLAALNGVEPPEPGDAEPSYVFYREGEAAGPLPGRTIAGRALLSRDRLKVETNSVRRADLLRGRIETACGGLLRHRAREHSDPLALADASTPAGAPPEPAVEPPTAEMEAALREIKERYYADWLDQPLPALRGQTPRQAARTARGREQVDALLKEIENLESRMAPGSTLDLRPLRKELGLD